MKKILFFIFIISACTVQKRNTGVYYSYFNGDSTDYVRYSVNYESVTIDFRDKLIAVMDTEHDTLPQFRLKLPTTDFQGWTGGDYDLYFFYKGRKAVFIHRDSHDKSTSTLQIKERSDSLDRLSPWCDFEEKKMMKIMPENDKYTYKCLTRNDTRIYIYNFKKEELDNVVEMIRNSFEYLPFDE